VDIEAIRAYEADQARMDGLDAEAEEAEAGENETTDE
jgi:predicted transcriptional regulator